MVGSTRKNFVLVFLVLLSVAAGNTALQSIMPAIGRRIGISDLLVALIFSLSALIWTFAAPYWARASDRYGRKRLMKTGLLGFAVSTLACGFVILAGLEGWIAPFATFVLFALARTMFGLFGAASNPAAQAYVAARTEPQQRTAALALLASAFGLGTILGPAVAPLFVVPVLGLSGPLFAFAAVGLIVLAAIQRLLPDDAPDQPASVAQASMPATGGSPTGATAARGGHARLSWRDGRIAPFMFFGIGIGSAQAATGQAMGFLIIDRLAQPPEVVQPLIGIAFMAGAGATLLVQWGLIRMFDLRPGTLMRWGAALAAAGSIATGLASDYHGIVVAYALACAGYGFARPGFTAAASLSVGPEEQGAVAGAVTAVNGASFILAPAVGIGLYQFYRPLPYLVAGAGLLLLLIYVLANPLLRRADVMTGIVPPQDDVP